MRYLTLALIALVGTGCGWPVSAEPAYERVHAATLRLEVLGGSCSGTAISRTWILGASHCFSPETKTIRANGELCEVHQIINDGNDHALVRLGGCTFKATAKLGKVAKVGAEVFMWGSPQEFRDLLRFGRIAGHHAKAMPGMGTAQIVDITGGPGDSGAGVFNMDGTLSGVISIGNRMGVMGTFPLRFTDKQWSEAL
jgi:hypothetical protein